MRCSKCGAQMLISAGGARPVEAPAARPPQQSGEAKETPAVGLALNRLIDGEGALYADLPALPNRTSSPGPGAMADFGQLDDLLDLPGLPEPDAPELPLPASKPSSGRQKEPLKEARKLTPSKLVSPQLAKPTVPIMQRPNPEDWMSLNDDELAADLPMVPDRDSYLPAPAKHDSFGAIELPAVRESVPPGSASSGRAARGSGDLPAVRGPSSQPASRPAPKRSDSIDFAFDFEGDRKETAKVQRRAEEDRPTQRGQVPYGAKELRNSRPDALPFAEGQKTAEAELPLAAADLDAIEFGDAPLDIPHEAPAEPPGAPLMIDFPLPEGAGPAAGGFDALPPLEFAPLDDALALPEPPVPAAGKAEVNTIELEKEPSEFQFKDIEPKNDQMMEPARAERPKARARPEEEEKPKKSKLIRNLVVAGVLIVGGSSLALVPGAGAFGWMWAADAIFASSHAQALSELKSAVQANLAVDSYPTAAGAYAKARAAQQNAPRHRPTASYTAYVAFARSLRFGRKGGDEAHARQLLAYASEKPSPEYTLAVAAEDALGGQLDKARGAASGLLRSAPQNIDAAVLLGEIELQAKSYDKAIAAWKRALEINKNARTLYGMARAEYGAGQMEAAERDARAVLEASALHAGARILLASILWARSEKDETEALSLLSKVTSDGDVKNAASERDIVEANALLGTVHLSHSRITVAEDAFRAALKLDPQAMGALLGSGELLFRAGRFSEASARYEAAMRADAENVEAKVGAAKTWISQERAKEAKDLLRKAREARPKEPLFAYWFGRAEEALGNKKEAEGAYTEAIALGKDERELVNAYVSLSYLLGSLGRSEEAAAKLSEAGGKFPGSAALHGAKGEIALALGRYEEAKEELETALESKDDLGTRFKLGVTLRRMRAFDEAAKVFDKVASLDPEYPGLSLERGLLFEETGQTEKALDMYKAALEKAPDDLDLKLRVGSAQVMAGKGKLAEPLLREVVKQRPNSAEASHFLGRALLTKGVAIAEALRFLERATEIDPNRAEYFLYVGWAANEAGQPAKADGALKKALELDHELSDAHWQRGVLLQKQGATADALAELQIALQKRPSRFEAYATMALCFQDQARWPEAEEAWRKAIAGNDEVPEWHYRIGKIYAARGNKAASGAEMLKVIAQVEASEKPKPAWLFDAHFLAAEALRMSGDKAKAIEHFKRFLDLSPPDNAYRTDAEAALKSMGAWEPR